MNKSEFVAAIAAKAGTTKVEAEKIVAAYHEVVTETLVKGEKIQLIGFGNYEVSERAAREGRNPATGAAITIAACKLPKFTAGKALKDKVNGKK